VVENSGTSAKGASVLKFICFVATLALVAGGQASALGDTDHLSDPRDTPGLLDVEDVRQAHGDRPAYLRHRITMFNSFEDRVLGAGGEGDIAYVFSTGGDSCAEKRVLIERQNGELKAFIQDYDPICGGGDDFRAIGEPVRMHAKVGRPDSRTIVLGFERSELGDLERNYYSWSVQTKFKADECSDKRNGLCVDNAPDSGRGKRGVLAHDLS
jgi:hypothetical protein